MSHATDRLERSRAALAEAMQRGGLGPPHARTQAPTPQGPDAGGAEGARDAAHPRRPPWQRWMDAARRRWHAHPLHLVAEIAVPALGAWAARRPLTFLAMAAAAGAGLVATRPWRVLSATGVLAMALRAMGVPSFALAGLRMRRSPRRMATRVGP